VKKLSPISGFSKLSKKEKIDFLKNHLVTDMDAKTLESFWHANPDLQKILDEFSENTITNFPLPMGLVPNLMINKQLYCVPMVIEESSVVAACANSAKFWLNRGGYKTEVIGTSKIGHVHFKMQTTADELNEFFHDNKDKLLNSTLPITEKMEKRGGGIRSLRLVDKTKELENYYQLELEVETCDAMGANFINSILEHIGKHFGVLLEGSQVGGRESYEVIMAILSNYTPNCIVRAQVSCSVEDLNDPSLGMSGEDFARRIKTAVDIARADTYRATTHNKGIFNGVDAVILATGNDFRAVEACGHTYAARDGVYRGLTRCDIRDGEFKFWIDLPLAVGTVGGLTKLHPLSSLALDILGNPSASRLMEIVATVGLAQNFGALRSLVTTGIQKGHMKMHLMNILNQLGAGKEECEKAKNYFEKETVSFNGVRDFIENIRED